MILGACAPFEIPASKLGHEFCHDVSIILPWAWLSNQNIQGVMENPLSHSVFLEKLKNARSPLS